MATFKHVYFVINPEHFDKVSDSKTTKEFLPVTSSYSLILKTSQGLRLWFRADTLEDVAFFREKLKNIPYQWGEDHNKLQSKD
jgi:hypothetical protein